MSSLRTLILKWTVLVLIPGNASSFVTAPHLSGLSLPKSFLKSTATPEDKTSNNGIRPDLPDYGKTSIDIDKHKIVKIKKWRRPDLEGQTLIDETLSEMKNDAEFQETARRRLELGEKGVSLEERRNRGRVLDDLGVPSFNQLIANSEVGEKKGKGILHRQDPEVLQLNIGLYCNQACGHCHVESSPLRTKEQMSSKTAAKCLDLLRKAPTVHTLDITGGAPELNANFRYLVSTARAMCDAEGRNVDIIDRCNLTVLKEPGQEDLVSFLKENRVHIIASLPCYSPENVDKQRGSGVFERSISALLALNEAGYGVPGTGLHLDLVYNPLGAFLPPEQGKLEAKYKEVLDENFGIEFNQLFTMTNMPIKRFADFLHRRGELKDYLDLLVRNYNPEAAKSLMCLNTVSIGYDGKIFDCDFNQQLGYAVGGSGVHTGGKSVHDVNTLAELMKIPIYNDNHCFGCTAGMGSS